MRPLIVGLTGGIGSGKSTISHEFSHLGVPILDTDQIARDVVAIGQPALHELTEHFGPTILNSDGSLNRSTLRKIIFREPQQKRFVEELLHPLILEQTMQQVENIDSAYVIVEIPLLIEANWQPFVDQILVVDLPEDLQIERLLSRKELSRSDIQQIINSQLPRMKKREYADQLIDNSKTSSELTQRVFELHQQYLRLSEMRHP